MNQEKILKLAIKLNNPLVSVNDLYRTKIVYVNGRPKATLYKNPAAGKVEQDVFKQLSAVDFAPYMDLLNNTKQFSILFQFVFAKKPGKRLDTSNYVKNIEDIFVKYVHNVLGIDRYDDCLHIEVFSYKSFVPTAKNDMVFIQLKESHFNLRFDVLEKPEKVFIAQPDDALKKFLKKNKVKVKDKQEQSNTSIHLIPGPITPAKALEINTIVDEAEKFCYIGLMGPEPDSETLQALEMTTGGKSSIKIEWIGQSFDKILEWINSF